MRNPGKGQPQLPGLEYRPSIAQLLTPEAAGITQAEYADITDYRIAEDSQLRSSLIGIDWKDGRSVLAHQPAGRGAWVGIAVNPEDYNQVARSAEHLGKATVNKTLERYPIEERYLPEKEASAERSGIHAVEGKLSKIDARLEQIHHHRNLLEVLSEMAKGRHHNLQRGYESRDQFHELMHDVVGNMVNAVGIQRRFSQDQMTLMHRTIEKRMYLYPTNVGPRVHYFGRLANLGTEYYGHLAMIYARSRFEAASYVREHTT